MNLMDIPAIATAALMLLTCCCGTAVDNSTELSTRLSNVTTPAEPFSTFSPQSNVTPTSLTVDPSSKPLTNGELAAAIVVPIVIVAAVVVIVVYFLWFRHWLLRRRRGSDDGQEHGKVHIDAAGDAAPAMLRYSKNPSLKQRQEQAESMTAGYAAVGDHPGVGSDEPDYENLGQLRAAAGEDSQAMYENVRSKSAAAKKANAAATGKAKAGKQVLNKKDAAAVPNYRAPAPPPHDVRTAATVTAVPDEGGSRGSAGGSWEAAVSASDPGAGVETYVKLVGAAHANQPAVKSPKNLPSSGIAAGKPQHTQAPRPGAGAAAVSGGMSSIGTAAAATAAGDKSSKGKVLAVALKPPGLAGKARPEPEVTEDDTYVVPEADEASADLGRPPMKPMASVTSEDSQLYIEPQGDDVYENY